MVFGLFGEDLLHLGLGLFVVVIFMLKQHATFLQHVFERKGIVGSFFLGLGVIDC